MEADKQSLNRLAIYEIFSRQSPEASAFRTTVYQRYADIAEAFGSDPMKLNLIKGNQEAFKILEYDQLPLTALVTSREKSEYTKIAANSPDLKKMFESTESFYQVLQKLSDVVGQFEETGLALEDVTMALQKFNPSIHVPEHMDDDIPDEADYDIDDTGDGIGEVAGTEEDPSDEDDEGFSVEDLDNICEGAPGKIDLAELGLNEQAAAISKGTEQEESDQTNYDEAELQRQIQISKEEASRSGSIDAVDDECKDNKEDDNIDISDVGLIPDIEEMVSAIVNRNEAVFRSCLELDRPYGMIYNKGLLSFKLVPNEGAGKNKKTLRYIPGESRGGSSIFEKLFKSIMTGTGAELSVAPDLRNVPNAENIKTKNSNYYPGYMFKYALGVVDDNNHRSWKSFETDLRKSVTIKLKKMYKQDIIFSEATKIEQSFSNAILVLSYEPGSGIKLRVSLPGRQIDKSRLENSIRSIQTYVNSAIAITNVMDYNDVVDVQILQNEDKFLDRPYWAYKAMKVKIDNGDAISLSNGLPIGRKSNGEIVEYKLDPSNRFLTFLAAGSGAGKGVLTLSLVAAAIGSGLPLFYMDFKPDMAPIFWNIEKQFNINTFAYDGMVQRRANSDAPNHVQGYGMPAEIKSYFDTYAGAIVYMKAVQLMCSMAQYRADHGVTQDIMFVFDETQAMQRLVKAAVEKTVELKKTYAPKKGKGAAEDPKGAAIYQYASILLDWFKDVDTNINTYVITTGRKSNTFCLFIGQSPDWSTWTELKAKADEGQLGLLSRITFADTIFKILGRGSTTSKYGLGGDGKKNISPKELKYVANNRFFGMYDGKTTDGADIKIFKPFLTLNTDDPLDKCWTKGMGKKFGYESVPDEQYFQNIAAEHPGEEGFTNAQGIHTGTGLLGLTSMYCGGDVAKVAKNFGGGWEYTQEFFALTGLNAKYANPSDYMYDASIDGLMFIRNMVQYSPSQENSVRLGLSTANEDGDSDSIEVETDTIIEDGRPSIPPITSIPGMSGAAGTGSVQNPLYGIPVQEKSEEEKLEEQAFQAYTHAADNEPVSKERIDELLRNIMADAPDGSDILDFTSQAIPNDIADGVMTSEEAEALARSLQLAEKGYTTGYDYSNGEVDSIQEEPEVVRQPVAVNNDPRRATNNIGNSGRRVVVDTAATKQFTQLNDENSINCRGAGPGEINAVERAMLGTPRGAARYVSKMWKSVLSTIISQGYNPANISRVSLYGGQMYVNGKYIILDGVIGGRQNIRLKDIAEFKVMFKRMPMIKELRLDEEMIQVALTEFGSDPIFKMFQISNKLSEINIKMRDGSTQKCTRQSAQDEKAQKILAQNQLENDIDTLCKSKGPGKWSGITVGDDIWGMKLAKSSMGRAGEAFLDKNKPSVGKTLIYGTVGIIGGAVGFGLWGIAKSIKGIFTLGKSFRS